jgi:hypothetical protein
MDEHDTGVAPPGHGWRKANPLSPPTRPRLQLIHFVFVPAILWSALVWGAAVAPLAALPPGTLPEWVPPEVAR